MGDYDAEIYRTVNDAYGELTSMRSSITSVNENIRLLLDEIKGLRQDIRDTNNKP